MNFTNEQRRPDGAPSMNNRELDELKEKLKLASEREIAFIFAQMGHKDPFVEGKKALKIPSTIRQECIQKIEAWFRNGLLTAQKNG